MKKGMIALLALAFTLAVVGPVWAEDPAQEVVQGQKAETKALRQEIVNLKYTRAQDIQNLLYPFRSRDGRIELNPNMPMVLVISDLPENLERTLAAIRELDVKPADVLFTVQLVLGSEEQEKDVPLMAASDPIIKELRSLLKYNFYSLLDTSMVRALDKQDSEVRLGEKADFELWMKPKVVKDKTASLIQTEVRLRQIRVAGMPPAATSAKPEFIVTDLIGTTLNIRSGDKTVVGVSKLDGTGKGLILIISGKIVD
ncbi:MAG: hypothetical protein ACXW2O_03925 [Candidatus Aminicenantales bacterium]